MQPQCYGSSISSLYYIINHHIRYWQKCEPSSRVGLTVIYFQPWHWLYDWMDKRTRIENDLVLKVKFKTVIFGDKARMISPLLVSVQMVSFYIIAITFYPWSCIVLSFLSPNIKWNVLWWSNVFRKLQINVDLFDLSLDSLSLERL